ncbi:MAG TPA: DNA-binding response regulator [Anaerolineaceae bacterium]|nr:DNA-binding response regulator [Anaerolineaceae bacterium]
MDIVRVLLADDHAIVRSGIRRTIEQIEGMEVVGEAENGPQVQEILQQDTIDLLLIDVTMPEFDPIETISKIRLLYPSLKILVVSAYDDDFYVKGLLSAGVNGYHMKDQPLNDLRVAIERVMAGERWISSSLINKLYEDPQISRTIPLLTARQRSLLRYLLQGMDNKSIADTLGLSIKTVENHLTRLYRQIDVQSRLEAVNFTMCHPQILGTPGSQVLQSEDADKAKIQHSITILVVDDNARYRKQLLRMIAKANPRATIYEAESIHETIQIAQHVNLQLVLVDVVLGDEDGIACVRRIKSIHPQCRVILISAYPDREFHRQGIESGAVAFLDKQNLDLPTLKQVIDDVTGKFAPVEN